jgi:hypothetical protein
MTTRRQRSAVLDREIVAALRKRRKRKRHHSTRKEDLWDVAMDAIIEGDAARAAEVTEEIGTTHRSLAPTQAFSKALHVAPRTVRQRYFDLVGLPGSIDDARPASFPKRLRHGGYTATFQGVDENYPGDPNASARWTITRAGKAVGTMWEGRSYGWGKPSTTMRELVWGGAMPPGESDSRTPEYGIGFDQGPAPSHEEALAKFARAADRLITWRQKHGHPAQGFKRKAKK